MDFIRDTFKTTVVSLHLAEKECAHEPTALMIDGLIQRFEFCVDFSLKTCREYIDTAGHTVEGDDKTVLTKAKNIGLIDNLDTWLDILNDRQATKQIYHPSVAQKIMLNCKRKYMIEFLYLAKKFS